MDTLKIGDKVVMNAHGVGVISRFEPRKIDGRPVSFLVIRILGSGATLMVPARAAESSGLRPIIDAAEVPAVLKALSEPAKFKHTTWNRRYREYNDLLRTGSLPDVARVLRDLMALQGEKDLSYGEVKMRDKATSLLCGEISLSLGIDERQAACMVQDALGGAPKLRPVQAHDVL